MSFVVCFILDTISVLSGLLNPFPPKLSPHLTHIVDPETFFKNLNSSLFLTVKSQPSGSVKPDFPTYTFPMCISKEEKSFHFF